MELRTTAAFESGEDDLIFVTFYDEVRGYGFSISRQAGSEELEVMVSDQSNYYLSDFDVCLERNGFTADFPAGTIDCGDGEDHYQVRFQIDEGDYANLVTAFQRLFTGKKGLTIRSDNAS